VLFCGGACVGAITGWGAIIGAAICIGIAAGIIGIAITCGPATGFGMEYILGLGIENDTVSQRQPKAAQASHGEPVD